MKSIFSGFHYDSSTDKELHTPPSSLPPPTPHVPIDPATAMVVYQPREESVTASPTQVDQNPSPSHGNQETCDSSSSAPREVTSRFPVVDLTGDVPVPALPSQGVSSRLRKRQPPADLDSRDSKRPSLHRDKGTASRGASSKDFEAKRFISSEAVRRYGFFVSRTLAPEVCYPLDAVDKAREFIDKAGLLKTITQIGSYDSEVVYEFLANLPTVKSEGESVDLLVRDWTCEFSPCRINVLFGLRSMDVREQQLQTAAILEEDLALFLSDGKVKPCKQLVSTAIKNPVIKDLYRICCSNWSPTVNTRYISTNRALVIYMIMHGISFDFGRMIYNQIIQLGLQAQSGFRLPFPSLIYQLLTAQRPVPSLSSKDAKKAKGKKTAFVPVEPVSPKGSSAERKAIRVAIKILQDALEAGLMLRLLVWQDSVKKGEIESASEL
ncbi:PREDICTED: uncharacterized protein LOC104752022 [Camelina sativa]|uniref:Uncharacterized protein LOC104752022 n=1 Tax=Camelina sativa TaxID=90675 RepID=A0ABM0WKI4_CAMSA|nr:PREDICTED: uncharacterized protein LOC104752022 [Camelina sativa]